MIFLIYYEDELDILYKYEKEQDTDNLSDYELDEILKAFSDIKYVVIEWLYITPKRIWLGKELMAILIENLKAIDKIEKYI